MSTNLQNKVTDLTWIAIRDAHKDALIAQLTDLQIEWAEVVASRGISAAQPTLYKINQIIKVLDTDYGVEA